MPPEAGECPKEFVPQRGHRVDFERECVYPPVVVSCSRGSQGVSWCIVDTRDGTAYAVGGNTCWAYDDFEDCSDEQRSVTDGLYGSACP